MSIDYSAMKFPKASWKQQDTVAPKRKRQKKLQCNRVAPVQRKKRKKYKKVPSIMQHKDDKRCYLCMILDNEFREHAYTEEHHVIFGDEKWVSDAKGLRVNLCRKHHRESPVAVHSNQEHAELLKRIAQQKFMEAYPDEKWHDYVEKNYL